MGKPGAKKNDPIVSVTPGDVHIIMIPSPGGPVPTPIPHPCASMIKDKVATKVKVMGQPGAVKGSKSKHTPPHIPMGPGPFQKPPKNEGEIVTGSSSVFYEGKEAAMLGDTGKMCSDPSDTPVGKVIGTAAMVLVGGGSSGGDAERAAASAAAMKAAAAACHQWIAANMTGAAREQARRDVCSATGHPIDVATGKVFTKAVEIVLKGPIPFEFTRNYSSARSDRGGLGIAWRHSWDIELVHGEGFVALRDENGRMVPFAPVEPQQATPSAVDRLVLERDSNGSYSVRLASGLRYRFGQARPASDDTFRMPLIAIEDSWRNEARLRYDDGGRLTKFIDTAGRVVEFIYNANGLISELRLQDNPQNPVRTVRRYTYENGLLVAAVDAVGGRWSYEYADHLLTREGNRNGDSFYFAYDREGWCVETWGDGGLLYRRLEYDRAGNRTLVTNGQGYRRLYKWNAQGVVEEETDHEGRTLRFQYNEFIECIAEENAVGDRWTYEYDPSGRVVALSRPDGVGLTYKWDDLGRLMEKLDPLGGKWSWTYNDRERMSASTDPLGQKTFETRDEHGRIVKILAADGREVRLSYDAAGNCVELINGDGLHVRRSFNSMGDLVRESDQYGIRFETAYDDRGYPAIIRIRGQGEIRFERDAEGRITRLTDSRGHQYEYSYLPFLAKVSRLRQTSGVILADGSRVVPERLYSYDSEARLIRMEVNGERAAEFTYAEHKRPIRIRYSDGREHVFERNEQGIITSFRENGDLVFTQEADACGRVVHRLTGDGEEFFFDYDPLGNLTSGAATGGTKGVEFEHDPLGRVAAQRGSAGEVEFQYDAIGMCTGYRRDNLALDFNIRRAAQSGRDLTVVINGHAAASLAFDARERLIASSFVDGDRHEYSYANDYSPSERRIVRNGRDYLWEQFSYDPVGLPVRCERQDRTAQVWERDARDRLVLARSENGTDVTTERRWGYNATGDRTLTTTAEGREQRVSFSGHRPNSCGDETYKYDRRGRLVTRTDHTGAVTHFDWNSLSQLRRVRLPNGDVVEYDYDVLGRRVAKRYGEQIDRFDWIDNHLVHESSGNGEERHYLYHTRSFAPLACLTSSGGDKWRCCAVTTDYRGAPILVTAPGSRDVWRADVMPWGERRVHYSEVAMPLALQGQYEDKETGLYYNNARYYNATTATYISPDPIGLAGGDNCYRFVSDPMTDVDPLGLNPENIALGLSTYKVPLPNGGTATATDVLTRFANDPAGDGSVRATTYSGFDKVTDENGIEDFGAKISNAMDDSKVIHFNLEGIGNDPKRATVADIVNNPDPSRFKPPSTEWELATILSNPELKAKTIFYDKPGALSEQIKCG